MQTERDRLAAEYRAAVTAYGEAVAAMDGLTDASFENARVRARQARLVCEEWRRMLENYDRENALKKAAKR